MRTITSVCFGLALAATAFTLTGSPASALRPSATDIAAPNGVVKVDERDEYREREERRERREREEREARVRGERCEHARRECRERHGDRDREFRECLERARCER